MHVKGLAKGELRAPVGPLILRSQEIPLANDEKPLGSSRSNPIQRTAVWELPKDA